MQVLEWFMRTKEVLHILHIMRKSTHKELNRMNIFAQIKKVKHFKLHILHIYTKVVTHFRKVTHFRNYG